MALVRKLLENLKIWRQFGDGKFYDLQFSIWTWSSWSHWKWEKNSYIWIIGSLFQLFWWKIESRFRSDRFVLKKMRFYVIRLNFLWFRRKVCAAFVVCFRSILSFNDGHSKIWPGYFDQTASEPLPLDNGSPQKVFKNVFQMIWSKTIVFWYKKIIDLRILYLYTLEPFF